MPVLERLEPELRCVQKAPGGISMAALGELFLAIDLRAAPGVQDEADQENCQERDRQRILVELEPDTAFAYRPGGIG